MEIPQQVGDNTLFVLEKLNRGRKNKGRETQIEIVETL